MASILKVDEMQGVTNTNEMTIAASNVTVTSEGGSATMQLQQGLCKCWFVSETLAISSNTEEDSLNVSSTTDAALGDLRPTYTNNFSNANYEALGCNHGSVNDVVGTKYSPNTTSTTRYLNYEPKNEVYKDVCLGGAIFGDLA